MTEKRFTGHDVYDGVKERFQFYDNHKRINNKEVLNLLNELANKNEQLKQAYTQLKHRHSLLHDVCIDAECDRDSYSKDIESLEKENEQLKSDKEHLMGCLIRFFGYDDEDIDYNLNRESNREYGKQYYSMKEETKKGLAE